MPNSNNNQLEGKLHVQLQPNKDLDTFCKEHIPNYDVSRFEAIALRVLVGREVIITIFAHDKQSKSNGNLLVKKFKLENITLDDVSYLVSSFNFTISDPRYDLEKMKILNK